MITLTREEAQQVLDALDSCEESWIYDGEDEHPVDVYDKKKVGKAIETLRARLSAPEPEPVACIVKDCENHKHQGRFVGDICSPCHAFITRNEGKYSQAYRNAQREWQGLTDDEIKEIVGPWGSLPVDGYTRKLFDQIETKLKEKNHG
jgi:hypothetical protein